MELFSNFPLWAALTAIVFAQIVKIPIQFIASRHFNPGLAFSTGGMPSSHSAAVTALATAVGLQEGLNSNMFAIACVLAIIVMFDATGVRRQAGEQAILLNKLAKDFTHMVEEARVWSKKAEYEKREELKELLGHQPIEVFFGGVTGVLISIILFTFI
ncbi:divergent PAP2 family protein [Pontibacillus yanchengensis]|uniref:Divergent PAP2 family protein n=2 Tax=Pontibacillus yanchengensis TaxID=462910 RepID=A0ACC7VKW5_9BACI|nr:divergent PAP2 family protein [Pontibacillus yanchengensis]MYL33762.1 divergent PAP2 family protein [Pontibacillus yanchengensis]MYL55340.1 divergent PAP2 family protein [Pontibacillus yanchengensis]